MALLRLPFFQTPNELCPFFEWQQQGAALQQDPTEGLQSLAGRGIWDSSQQKLTQQGKELLLPLFAPQARMMLFTGASATRPLQEYYVYNNVIVRYSSEPDYQVTGPFQEYQIVEHFRRVFPDRRAPYTTNNVSLYEPEFIALSLIEMVRQEEKSMTMPQLYQRLTQTLQGDGLELAIMGRLGGQKHEVLIPEDDFEIALTDLMRDGLAMRNPDHTISLVPETQELFEYVVGSRELYMIREEIQGNQLFAREASIINSARGYILGRSVFDESCGAHIVHLEDIEWPTLFRIINEITRPLHYLEQMVAEIRFRAHLGSH